MNGAVSLLLVHRAEAAEKLHGGMPRESSAQCSGALVGGPQEPAPGAPDRESGAPSAGHRTDHRMRTRDPGHVQPGRRFRVAGSRRARVRNRPISLQCRRVRWVDRELYRDPVGNRGLRNLRLDAMAKRGRRTGELRHLSARPGGIRGSELVAEDRTERYWTPSAGPIEATVRRGSRAGRPA